MFKPQTMHKVELIVPEHDVIVVTEALAASNAFHLAKTGHLIDDPDARHQNEWHERAAAFTALEQRILAIMKSLGVEEGIPPARALHTISPNVAQIEVEHLEEATHAVLYELEHAQEKLAQLQHYRAQLEPVADLDVELDALRDMRYTFALLGTMPIPNVERLKSSLEHIPFVLEVLRHQEHLAAVALFGLQRDAEILTRAARSAYLNPLKPPEMYRGTPAEAIEALEAGIARTQQHIEESQTAIQHLLKLHIRHLRHLLWRVRASHTLVETIAGYDHLHHTYLINGWVPAPQMTPLQQRIAQVSAGTTIEATSLGHRATVEELGEEAQSVPITFANPRLIRPFQGLVTNYGYPRYGELDPTPILALTFPLVFGIMFGDVGHGLILLLAGLLLASGRVKALRGAAGFGGVIMACGAAAMAFGFLYGSLFGFEELLPPLWVRPLESITDVLLATVGVGAAVLSIGMVCAMLNALLAKQWGR
ncbi:MAG: V-type ATPase 116kDa subunit family protein, partial [Anaerolineae bacterium]|nr:V-type ATPase 116kDa subunit family protein [Anaerolineae bacterium]